MKIRSSLNNKNGNPAYPINDPNNWWFAEKATNISLGGKWETISLNVTIKENYDAKKLYVNVSTWVLGDKTIDFDDLEVIIDRPVKRITGKRQYELSNHLGNVLATISDRKIGIDLNNDGIADFYDAEVISIHDYYPFGMQISARSFQSHEYKYGFNGMEKDDEVKGDGNFYDFGLRCYDPRLARMMSIDPRAVEYPWQTTYAYHRNSPIWRIDYLGGGDDDEFGEEPKDESKTNKIGSFIIYDGDDNGGSSWCIQNTPYFNNKGEGNEWILLNVADYNGDWGKLAEHIQTTYSDWTIKNAIISGHGSLTAVTVGGNIPHST